MSEKGERERQREAVGERCIERQEGGKQTWRDRESERVRARAASRERDRKRQREREGARAIEQDRVRERTAVRAEARRQQAPRARAWAHARTHLSRRCGLTFHHLAVCGVCDSEAAPGGLGQHARRRQILHEGAGDDHPVESVKVPCPSMASSCHAPS